MPVREAKIEFCYKYTVCTWCDTVIEMDENYLWVLFEYSEPHSTIPLKYHLDCNQLPGDEKVKKVLSDNRHKTTNPENDND